MPGKLQASVGKVVQLKTRLSRPVTMALCILLSVYLCQQINLIIYLYL